MSSKPLMKKIKIQNAKLFFVDKFIILNLGINWIAECKKEMSVFVPKIVEKLLKLF